MGKKVKVTTKCGGEFFYDHDQEVDTVEIVEVPTEPFFNEPQSLDDVKKMVEFLHGGKWRFSTHGGKWRFSTNTSKTTYESLKDFVKAEPENVAIVPWAFFGSYRYRNCFSEQRLSTDNIKMEGSSVWVRCLESTARNEE